MSLSWNDFQTGAVQFVSASDFFELLVHSNNLVINGWAQEHDLLYPQIQAAFTQYNDHMEVMGALEINNIPVIFLFDPDDGYRSHLNTVALVPGQHLQTRLPNIPIDCVAHDTSSWDLSHKDTHLHMIDVIALDTQECIVEVGTEIYDSYYPSGVLRFDIEAVNRSLPDANNRVILEEVGEHLLKNKSSRAKKI